jgi:hypothetical protein
MAGGKGSASGNETTDPIGSPEKLLTSVQLEAKFRDCADERTTACG